MRLAFFCSLESLDTGMPICTHKLIAHVAARKEHRVFAVFPGEGDFPARVRLLGIEPALIPFTRLRSIRHVAAFARAILSLPAAQVRFFIWLRRNRIDLVHFSDVIDLPFFWCARLAGCRVVAHVRQCLDTAFRRWAYRCCSAPFVDRYAAVSDAVRRIGGLPAARTVVIHDPGPEPDLFTPERPFERLPGLDAECLRITAISRFVEVKGLHHFVRMACIVRRERPGGMQFVILGDRSPGHERYHHRVMEDIRREGLSSSLVILGQIPHQEVPRVLAQTGVFVHLPAYQEAFPGVVLEAMAMCVPVVAFDSGGVRECFADGVSGFLVRQFDVAAAAERVLRLTRDPELRVRIGDAARAECLRRFSLEKHAAQVEEVYRALAKGKRGSEYRITNIES